MEVQNILYCPLKWTDHLTPYVTSVDMKMQRIHDTFAVNLNTGTSEKPSHESLKTFEPSFFFPQV